MCPPTHTSHIPCPSPFFVEHGVMSSGACFFWCSVRLRNIWARSLVTGLGVPVWVFDVIGGRCRNAPDLSLLLSLLACQLALRHRCILSASALALLAFSWASACRERSYSSSVAFSKSFSVVWHPCFLLNSVRCTWLNNAQA